MAILLLSMTNIGEYEGKIKSYRHFTTNNKIQASVNKYKKKDGALVA